MIGTVAELLKSCFARFKRRRLDAMLAVEWDEKTVRVRVLEELPDFWNQEIEWADIRRVCFKDEGVFSSDIIFLELVGRERPAFVLTEARQGTAFVGELVRRGLFSTDALNRAVAMTNGGMVCWPPKP
jgi:hypothetical protein